MEGLWRSECVTLLDPGGGRVRYPAVGPAPERRNLLDRDVASLVRHPVANESHAHRLGASE
jgi:hypothetical protein